MKICPFFRKPCIGKECLAYKPPEEYPIPGIDKPTHNAICRIIEVEIEEDLNAKAKG